MKKFLNLIAKGTGDCFAQAIAWSIALVVVVMRWHISIIALGVCAILVAAAGVNLVIHQLWERVRFEYLIHMAVIEPDAEIHEGPEPCRVLTPVILLAVLTASVIFAGCVKIGEIAGGGFDTMFFVLPVVHGILTLVGIIVMTVTYVWLRAWRRQHKDQEVTIRGKMKPLHDGTEEVYTYVMKTGRLHEFSFAKKDQPPDWLR